MATVVIPISLTQPRKDYLVELDGKDWLLDLSYHPRGQYVMMSVKDSAGVLRAAGQKLAGNAPMLRLFDADNLPPGMFWVDARGNGGNDPTRDTLGTSVFLLYEEANSV